jgi:hypothetical protein
MNPSLSARFSRRAGGIRTLEHEKAGFDNIDVAHLDARSAVPSDSEG